MKLLFFLFLGGLAVKTSIAAEDVSRVNKTLDAHTSSENKENSNLPEEFKNFSHATIEFYLYTRKNPTFGTQIVATSESISASEFNSIHPTRIIIHSYFNSQYTPMITAIRKAWLDLGHYNVIVVDWHAARDRMYANSVPYVPKVGKTIAHLIDHLVKNHSMLLQTTHVIGYGLGAHVAGYAGKTVSSGQIHTIVGLNPMQPSFSYDEPSKRLNNTDAFYVETIQTDVNVFGYKKPIGGATFYPNGGFNQPGCSDFLCDHEHSAVYYAESIVRNNFAAISCKSYKDAINKTCGFLHSPIRMGGTKNPYMVSGVYYVPLKESSPFGVLP